MADFEKAYADLKVDEGGFSNDPRDKGGRTYMGITEGWLKKVHPEMVFADLTPASVKELYYNDWWFFYRVFTIKHDELAAQVFSVLVLCGPDPTFRLLQVCLNALNFDVEVDGVLGPVSTITVNQADGDVLLCAFRAASAIYLLTKDGSIRSMGPFDGGWLKRAMR